jgi:hypothetical protein
MSFQPGPPGLPIYNSLNWLSIITVPSNSSITITSAVYNPSTGQVDVGFSYASNIDASQLQISLNKSSIPILA